MFDDVSMTPEMVKGNGPEERDVHFVGCGSLGLTMFGNFFRSMRGAALTIHVHDNDIVEDRNRFNQKVFAEDVGLPKVDAVLKTALRIYPGSDITLIQHHERVKAGAGLSGIVIAGVDANAERWPIWKCVKNNPAVSFFVDARMGLDGGKVYGVDPGNPEHIARYEDPLHMHPDPPGLGQGCKTRFPMPYLADIVAGHALARLSEWLQLEQGSEYPYMNFYGFCFKPRYSEAKEYWDENDESE